MASTMGTLLVECRRPDCRTSTVLLQYLGSGPGLWPGGNTPGQLGEVMVSDRPAARTAGHLGKCAGGFYLFGGQRIWVARRKTLHRIVRTRSSSTTSRSRTPLFRPSCNSAQQFRNTAGKGIPRSGLYWFGLVPHRPDDSIGVGMPGHG